MITIDRRFLCEAGQEVFTGNELLVKGALETEGGVHLLTGYPGSPIAGFFDTLSAIGPLLREKGMVAKIANNEALSVAMVNGAQMAGCRAIATFKSVGMHVASDALALGVLAGTRGGSGGLIVCGDDPWSESTQVPADSRFLAEHLRLPIVEPSTPQEVKDWINLSFQLGAAGNLYIGLLITVALADGGGTVECRPNHYPLMNEKQRRCLSYADDIEPVLEETVLLPPRTGQREAALASSMKILMHKARELGLNRILCAPQKGERVPIGFISSGVGHAYLCHGLTELGLTGRLPILKLGMTYPIDDQIVIEFARGCDMLVVVEERRSFLERHVLEILNPLRQSGQLQVEVFGKQFPGKLRGIPATAGLNPSILMERLIPLIEAQPRMAIDRRVLRTTQARLEATAEYEISIPDRTPTFCPGCPHRDSSSVLLGLRHDLLDPNYMLAQHKRQPIDLVCHGDTGCYTMLMFEPNKPLMHNYSGMGLGGGTGSGVDPFIDNKQIVFMGDGTFFHSGQIAISHSIASGQDITYIILDNKTTAMTGHQTNPALEFDLTGQPCSAQDIERIVQAMIPKHLTKEVRLVRIDPADRRRYRQLLEQTILANGVKVVVADKECGITYYRRKRREQRQELEQQGFLARRTHMNIATEVCEYCLECTTQTGCPGLTIVDTDYGPKVQTDFSWCVNDGACRRIEACPSFEEVTIIRKQAPRLADEHVDLSRLADPPRPIHAEQQTWRCYLTGVGGMGIGVATQILVSAGHSMGYHVAYLDKKGLAIRNGGVFSQLVYSRTDPHQADVNPPIVVNGTGNGLGPTTPVIPYGQADLLLGVDLLEATRAIDPKYPQRVASQRTAAVVNTAKTPTILTLMGREDFDPQTLERVLARYCNPHHFFEFNVGDLCERLLDSKLYVNIMMLGIAYQKGFLPLTLEAIEKAIRHTVHDETDRNIRAFNIGRRIVVRPDLFTVEMKHEYESSRQALRHRLNTIRAFYRGRRGQTLAKQLRILMKRTFRATRGHRVEDQLIRDVVIRTYDCFVWGGINYAKRYCDRVVDVFQKDEPAQNYRLTRAAVRNLAKVMLIKDEIYVSALLTSPQKYKRDRRRYNVNPANGDRIVYRHFNRPEFVIFGHRIKFEWKSRDWQLRLMARLQLLRKVMPKWHEREKAFRDWYEDLVDRLEYDGLRDYERWLAILNTPANVNGFRQEGKRYEKQAAARRRGEQLLATDPQLFEPEVRQLPPAGEKDIPLPVLTNV